MDCGNNKLVFFLVSVLVLPIVLVSALCCWRNPNVLDKINESHSLQQLQKLKVILPQSMHGLKNDVQSPGPITFMKAIRIEMCERAPVLWSKLGFSSAKASS